MPLRRMSRPVPVSNARSVCPRCPQHPVWKVVINHCRKSTHPCVSHVYRMVVQGTKCLLCRTISAMYLPRYWYRTQMAPRRLAARIYSRQQHRSLPGQYKYKQSDVKSHQHSSRLPLHLEMRYSSISRFLPLAAIELHPLHVAPRLESQKKTLSSQTQTQTRNPPSSYTVMEQHSSSTQHHHHHRG